MTDSPVLQTPPPAQPRVMKFKMPGQTGKSGEATQEFRDGVELVKSGVRSVSEDREEVERFLDSTVSARNAAAEARDIAVAAKDTAVEKADIAVEKADVAEAQAEIASAASIAADASADSALLSAEAARVNGRIYPTIAAGEAATPVGEYFNVEAPSELDAVDYRLRTSTGSELRKTIPSSKRLLEEATLRAAADAAIEAREVKGDGLATGGGSLAASRTITVPAASAQDVTTGTSTSVAVTPSSLKPTVDDLRAETARVDISANGFPAFSDEYAVGDFDASGGAMVGLRHDGTVDIADAYAMFHEFYRFVDLSSDRSPMWGIGHDGLFYAPDTAPFITSEWLYVDFCSDGVSVWRGVRFDGTSYPPSSAVAGAVTAWTNGAEVNVLKNGRRAQITYNTPPGTVNVAPSATESKVTYLIDNGTTVVSRSEDLLCVTSLLPTVTTVLLDGRIGQSLGYGTGAARQTLVPFRPGRAVMFNAGDKVTYPLAAGEALPQDNLLSWVDAYEISNAEAPSMGFAWGMTEPGRLPATTAVLVTNHCMGGQPWSVIKKGGSIPTIWENFITTIKRSRIMAAINGLIFIFVLKMTHGEADRGLGPGVYKGYITQAQTDISADLGFSVPVIYSQMSAFTRYGLSFSEATQDQLDWALENRTKGAVACAKYHLTTVDGIHMNGPSSVRLGCYEARTEDLFLKGLDARPLYCESLIKSSAIVYRLRMHVPVGNLVIDTTLITDPGNYGIDWRQTGGTPRAISSVAIDGNDIVVTLNGDPGAFTAAHFGIAFYGDGAGEAFAGPTTGARSCFRDQAADLDKAGVPMPNHALHQRIPVPVS